MQRKKSKSIRTITRKQNFQHILIILCLCSLYLSLKNANGNKCMIYLSYFINKFFPVKKQIIQSYLQIQIKSHGYVNLSENESLYFLLKKRRIFYFTTLSQELYQKYFNYKYYELIFKSKRIFLCFSIEEILEK